jgi:hypothetical protein
MTIPFPNTDAATLLMSVSLDTDLSIPRGINPSFPSPFLLVLALSLARAVGLELALPIDTRVSPQNCRRSYGHA